LPEAGPGEPPTLPGAEAFTMASSTSIAAGREDAPAITGWKKPKWPSLYGAK